MTQAAVQNECVAGAEARTPIEIGGTLQTYQPRSEWQLQTGAAAGVPGRLRLLYRFARHGLRSCRSGDWDFVWNAICASAHMGCLSIADALTRRKRVECNICGWAGRAFYPNTGPGYHEKATFCPGCLCLDRQRALVVLLDQATDFCRRNIRVLEVAPMRRFEALLLQQHNLEYTSFDLARHAMEVGDITRMKYDTDSTDYFLCFHVLEHVPDETAALSEIRRVLKPGGCLVTQVPVDWSKKTTVEYEAPDPREVGHVRCYGQDFGERLERSGLEVERIAVSDVVSDDVIERFGLSREPVYFARKSAADTNVT